jgi:GTPase SAR1 family protein
VQAYLKSCAVLIVYDITKRDSFEAIEEHLTIARERNNSDNPIIFLVGNKLDVANAEPKKRQVRYEEALEFATRNNLSGFMEVSAHSGTNVTLVFE